MRLCASSRSAASKTLPQRLQRCCRGFFDPVAAVDMSIPSRHALLRVNKSSLVKTKGRTSFINVKKREALENITEAGRTDMLCEKIIEPPVRKSR